LLSSLAFGGAACTNADGAIVILQNQVADDQCVVPSSLATFLPRGIIDTDSTGGYVFNPLVQNNAVSNETKRRVALIQGAEIRLTLQEGLLEPSDQLTSLTDFTTRFSGQVQADGGFTSFSFTAIPQELLGLIATRLEVGVLTEIKIEATIFGEIEGGSIESNKFDFWVDVCRGCMKVDLGACTDVAASLEPLEGGVCNLLQDTKLECCTDSTSTEVCPAVREEPAE
jgi:hypothetical protein